MKRYVIIGDGVAGVSAGLAIRKADPGGTITILSGDNRPFYSRPRIVDVMTGRRKEEEIILLSAAAHRLHGFDLSLGVNVEAIDAAGSAVVAEGKRIHYDRLLIATGAQPKMPFSDVPGMFPLRTVSDATAIRACLPGIKRAVVYGGGPIGMKAAHALLLEGLPVTIVVTSAQILSRVLDEKAARIVEDRFRMRGATFVFQREIVEAVVKDGLRAVITDKGEEIAGQLAIVAKGVRPDCGLARGTGITVDAGILVGEGMETTMSGIYAAGDVAQGPVAGTKRKEVVSLWHVGALQGRIAGVRMAGGEASYEGAVSSNSMEFFGLKCISMGLLKADDCDEVIGEEGNTYSKYLFRGNELQGALLLGQIDEAGVILEALRKGTPVINREALLNRRVILEQGTMEVLF
jgi:nitrite reductase (NADH) large subunit